MLSRLIAPDEREEKFNVSLRTLAIILTSAGASVLCLLPLLLEYFGSAWKPLAIKSPASVATQTGAKVAA